MTTHTICDLIRLHREQRSLSVAKAAELCGIQSKTFRAWNMGLSKPGRENLDKLFQGFGLTLDDFINDARLMHSEREHLRGMYK